jgi:hypothetical protein
MIQQYGGQVRLANNMLYTVEFGLPGKTPVTWQFTSRYSSFYAAIYMVRSVAGGVLDTLSDQEVATAIYNASIVVDNIIGDEETNGMARQEYVKFAAAIPLVNGVIASMLTDSNGETKRLGNLTIEKSSTSSINLKSLLGYLEKMMAYWESLLRTDSTTASTGVASAVRAKTNYAFPRTARVF